MQKFIAICLLGVLVVSAVSDATPQLRSKQSEKPSSGEVTEQQVQQTLDKIDALLKTEGGEHHAAVDGSDKIRFAEAKVSMKPGDGVAQKDGSAAADSDKFQYNRPDASSMRFKSSSGLNPNNAFPPGLYSFASPYGNGMQDFRTPYYGHFSGNYGPIGSPAGPFGMGSMSPHMDPRGFGAALANYSTSMMGIHPMWPIPPSPYPMHVPAPYNPWSAMPPFPTAAGGYMSPESMYNTAFGDVRDKAANLTLMGPWAFGPYGAPTHDLLRHGPSTWGINPGVYGMYPGYGFPHHGVIPATRPGYGPSYPAYPGYGAYAPNPYAMLGYMQGANPTPMGMQPQMGTQMPRPGYPGAYPPFIGMPHPLVSHPQLGAFPSQALTGSGVGYPHPDFDRYHSVASTPPPAPEGGGEAKAA